jgi:hypothetical protein
LKNTPVTAKNVTGRTRLHVGSAIDPLDEVLIDIEPVPDDRAKPYFELPYYEQRRDAYKPLGSRLAEYELRSVTQMVEQLEEGQITEGKADQIAATISRRRLSVRSGSGVGTHDRIAGFGEAEKGAT